MSEIDADNLGKVDNAIFRITGEWRVKSGLYVLGASKKHYIYSTMQNFKMQALPITTIPISNMRTPRNS